MEDKPRGKGYPKMGYHNNKKYPIIHVITHFAVSATQDLNPVIVVLNSLNFIIERSASISG